MPDESKVQVRITNVHQTENGTLVPKILSIKASRLFDYVDQIRNEANKRYTPNLSKKFDHLPLLSIWDLADTQEEFVFNAKKDLPKETVYNSKGIPVLIIIPEEEQREIGVNQTQFVPEKKREKYDKHLKNLPKVSV